MKSNRLSFNAAVAKHSLPRVLLLLLGYVLFLLFSFTLPLAHQLRDSAALLHLPENYFHQRVLNSAQNQAAFSFVAAQILAALLFSDLYNSRGATRLGLLPARRESIFLSSALVGLLPMLVAQFGVMLLSFFLTAEAGVPFSYYLLWFAYAALSLIAAFGFALFCAMLTGNLLIFILVYWVLLFAAVVMEGTVRACFSRLIYGYAMTNLSFSFLSPLYLLNTDLSLARSTFVQPSLSGLTALACYAATGLIFALLACLLYKKRPSECVGDLIAFPVLKPLFRICMGFGCGFVLAAFCLESGNLYHISGHPLALDVILILILGAALGWIIAEMLIERTLRIRRLYPLGLIVVCAVSALTIVIAEWDLTGYEKRVPDPTQVESVTIGYDTELSDPENLRQIQDLHQLLVGEKASYEKNHVIEVPATVEGSRDNNWLTDLSIPLSYRLKNGKSLHRDYIIRFYPSELDDPESPVAQYLAVLNSPEAVVSRMEPEIPLTEENLFMADLWVESEDHRRGPSMTQLNWEELQDLWTNGMIPDAEAGHFSLYTLVDTETNMALQTNLWIDITLKNPDSSAGQQYWNHSYRVFVDSENTLRWIEENTDISWTTLLELYSDKSAG